MARLGPADVSDGLLSLAGVRDDVAARAHDAPVPRPWWASTPDAGDSGTSRQPTAYDAARPFAAANLTGPLVQDNVLYRMDAQDWAIPDDGVQNDVGLGLAARRPGVGGLAARAGVPPDTARAGHGGLLHDPERDAGCDHRTPVPHRPFRGLHRRRSSRSAGDRGGHAAGVQQFLAAVAPQRTGESRS